MPTMVEEPTPPDPGSQSDDSSKPESHTEEANKDGSNEPRVEENDNAFVQYEFGITCNDQPALGRTKAAQRGGEGD